MALNLPQSVTSRVALTPIEDVLLAVLRSAFPDIPVYSLIPKDPPSFPFILVRKSRGLGDWHGDPRFIDVCLAEIQVFTQDPDGDEAGALVSEAIRVAMHEAFMTHQRIPGKGTILRIDMVNEPRRVTDWATAAGPVQYADLPAGVWRYETVYSVSVRKER